MPTIQAQDIVTAAIQDSQTQTTNRTALYDYTDRVHQRILRESQWRFLLSDPQYFITLPGVSGYELTTNTAPPGVFTTNLQLNDFANIAPGSVYNASDWVQIQEDPDNETASSVIINRDGSLRFGIPRTYSLSIPNPGTIYLKPVPDTENNYYPVPETPYVTFAPLAGCTLPKRIYYGVVTYVDSFGGESTPCVVPFTIAVPAGNVITVSSPLPVPGGNIATNQVVYNSWNLYIGYSLNNYLIQNTTPIALGTYWVEPINGLFTGSLPIPSTLDLPTSTVLSILPSGLLMSAPSAIVNPPFPYGLIDSTGAWWELVADPVTHIIFTNSIPVGDPGVMGVTQILLNDTGNNHTWTITVLPAGNLVTTVVATPPSTFIQFGPPTVSTISPLNGYVIQFRYYKSRNQITAPTDVLQIPYAYKDIVIAGVNYLANMYIDQRTGGGISERTMEWKRTFEVGLSQIRRDLRINYRKTDYIAPDVAAQYVVGNQQGIPTMGW